MGSGEKRIQGTKKLCKGYWGRGKCGRKVRRTMIDISEHSMNLGLN